MCARSIGSPVSPSRSRPAAKQALARSRSPASQWSPPTFLSTRAAPSESPAPEPQEIGEPLARGAPLRLGRRALTEDREGALVVTNRVVVRVDRARPVAGSQQVASALGPVRAEAPVVAEGLQIGEPLGPRAGGALERPSHPLVQLGPARQEEILVHDL